MKKSFYVRDVNGNYLGQIVTTSKKEAKKIGTEKFRQKVNIEFDGPVQKVESIGNW